MNEKKIVKNRVALVDVESALEYYKEKNPEEVFYKTKLAEITGVSVQTRRNFQNKESAMLGFILNLHELTGYPLEKIIKDVTNG